MRRDRRTLSGQTADRLIEMIVGGQFAKGDRLPSEFQLAELLDVGRGTIREAIKLLVSRSIVNIRRGEGTFIADKPGLVDDPLGLTFIENKKKLANDLFELRMLIEPHIAALAAERVTEKDIECIRSIGKTIEEKIKSEELYTQDDIAFHKAISMAAKNQVVTNIIPIIHSSVEIFVELRDEDLTKSTLVSHRAIIEAIAAQKPGEAKAAMTEHLQRNKRYIDRISEKEG